MGTNTTFRRLGAVLDSLWSAYSVSKSSVRLDSILERVKRPEWGKVFTRGADVKNLLDSLDYVVWTANPDGSRFRYENSAAERLFGLETSGSGPAFPPLVEIAHEDDRNLIVKSTADLMEKGRSVVEYRIVSGDHVRWVSDRKSLFRDTAGNPVRVGGVISDITDRKRFESGLKSLAVYDELTGLYNRRGFFAIAEKYLAKARRDIHSIWVFYIDLDDLKKINDQQGHSAGDLAIKTAARILNKTFRESDLIARIGGDEFVIMAPYISPGGHELLIQRLESNASSPGCPIRVSLSVGAAQFDPKTPCTLEKLLEEADREMFRVKARKKTEVVLPGGTIKIRSASPSETVTSV